MLSVDRADPDVGLRQFAEFSLEYVGRLGRGGIAVDELDVPDDIFRILKDALSRDPLERPQNIALLFEAIESIQSSREHEWEEAQHLFVQFSRNALEKIAPNFPSTPQAALPEAALAELRELCQIRTWEQPGPTGL